VASDVDALRCEHYNATIVHVRRVHEELVVLRIRPDAAIPPYEAGQWISVGMGRWEHGLDTSAALAHDAVQSDHITRRPFSISSPLLDDAGETLRPKSDEAFYELYFSLGRAPLGGPLPAHLFRREPGTRLWVADHPRGANTLAPVRPDDNVLFCATGTGEAPHNKMIWELLQRGHRGRIASVVTTRHTIDQAYRPMHEKLARLFPQYRYAAVATRDSSAARLQELFRDGRLEAWAGFRIDAGRTHAFLCGAPGMIGAPHVENGRRTYPAATGMIELLERERGLHAGGSGQRVDIHFERHV
jgi:ferredoxin--NADP+ reductase